MRRLFIILMLTLLPIQASWAAVCAYCPDDCISESATVKELSSDAAELDDEDECSRCQMGGIGIASSLVASRIFPHPNNPTLWDGSTFPDSGQADRPERPNWTRAA